MKTKRFLFWIVVAAVTLNAGPKADAKFLMDAVDAIWERADRTSHWRSPAEREKFKAAIDQARAVYQRLM